MTGGEGECSKEKRVKNTWGREEKEESWWLERENRKRKVHWDQQGLGPRLRVLRHMVGAKA
jgi:hypothetical protein